MFRKLHDVKNPSNHSALNNEATKLAGRERPYERFLQDNTERSTPDDPDGIQAVMQSVKKNHQKGMVVLPRVADIHTHLPDMDITPFDISIPHFARPELTRGLPRDRRVCVLDFLNPKMLKLALDEIHPTFLYASNILDWFYPSNYPEYLAEGPFAVLEKVVEVLGSSTLQQIVLSTGFDSEVRLNKMLFPLHKYFPDAKFFVPEKHSVESHFLDDGFVEQKFKTGRKRDFYNFILFSR